MSKRIVYIVGGVYGVSGMNQVLTQKINWLARNTDYELHMVLTERPDLPWALHIEPNVKWVNFGINFDELDTMPLARKLWHYRKKQKAYKQALTKYLMDLHADLVVSACRREVNFINDIPDGSHKIGEIHFDRTFYRLFNKPYLPHAVCQWISRRWIGSFIREVNRLDRFVVLTHEDFAHWPEVEQKLVIPNPVKRLSTEYSTCENRRVIACGRYTWQKGFDLLIQAWAKVKASHPDWQLDIYGGGDVEPFNRQAEEKGIADVVKCHSSVENIYEKYCDSSIFVLSSRYEGFGLVLVEAMSCGLPVVSFDCPCGPKDIIHEGVDGYLVSTGDIDALSHKICCLIEQPELRKTMSQHAIAHSKQYDEESIMPQWVRLFEDVIG